MFGCDSTHAFENSTVLGNILSLSTETDSLEDATRIFNGLFAGGNVIMPLE